MPNKSAQAVIQLTLLKNASSIYHENTNNTVLQKNGDKIKGILAGKPKHQRFAGKYLGKELPRLLSYANCCNWVSLHPGWYYMYDQGEKISQKDCCKTTNKPWWSSSNSGICSSDMLPHFNFALFVCLTLRQQFVFFCLYTPSEKEWKQKQKGTKQRLKHWTQKTVMKFTRVLRILLKLVISYISDNNNLLLYTVNCFISAIVETNILPKTWI